MLPLPNGRKHRDLVYSAPPQVGRVAPDAEFLDLASSRTLRLSELRGQVVLLDFWSVECGACQKPLADYHALAEKHGDDWRGRVTILTAATDEDPSSTRQHLRRRGWKPSELLVHAWCGWGKEDDLQNAARRYNVQALPTVCLIDAEGKIVWRGAGAPGDIEGALSSRLETRRKSSASAAGRAAAGTSR